MSTTNCTRQSYRYALIAAFARSSRDFLSTALRVENNYCGTQGEVLKLPQVPNLWRYNPIKIIAAQVQENQVVQIANELGRLISETLPPSLQTNPIRLPQFVRLDCEPDEESAVDKLRKASACLIDGGFISHARKQGSTATTKMSADA
nr:hypothetical protein Iba_chr07dCG8730 [Ipomoea batatas]